MALVGGDEAPDAGLLLRGQLARKVAQALEHALALRAQALLFVGGEKLLRVLFVAFGELALARRELRGPQRREHRRRILGGFRREPAVARAQIAQSPRHVFRRDAVRGALARALQQGRVRRKLVHPVPLVKPRDAGPEVLGLRGVEVEVARRHEADHGVGVVVGDAGGAAGRERQNTGRCQHPKGRLPHQ